MARVFNNKDILHFKMIVVYFWMIINYFFSFFLSRGVFFDVQMMIFFMKTWIRSFEQYTSSLLYLCRQYVQVSKSHTLKTRRYKKRWLLRQHLLHQTLTQESWQFQYSTMDPQEDHRKQHGKYHEGYIYRIMSICWLFFFFFSHSPSKEMKSFSIQ